MSNISNISNIFIYLAKENIYLFIYLFQKVQIIFRYISTQGCFVASSSCGGGSQLDYVLSIEAALLSYNYVVNRYVEFTSLA